MCNPVLGAVIGGGQAVLGHIGQVQAATQRNKNRAALYNAEKVKVEQQHRINIQNYYLRGVDAKDTWDENALEASLAREKQEVLLNEAVATAFQGMEGDYIKLQSDQRIGRYAEMSGVTARRGRTALKAAIGRAKATRQAVVDMQYDRARAALQEIAVAKDKADREARDMIGLEPERGPGPVKPKWDKGPSMLSLIVNTAIGAYGGYKMGKQLQGAKPGSVPTTEADITGFVDDYGGGISRVDAKTILDGGFVETVFDAPAPNKRGLSALSKNLNFNPFEWYYNAIGDFGYPDLNLGKSKPAWKTRSEEFA